MTDTETSADKVLTVGVRVLPSPRSIAAALKDQLNVQVLALREGRGEIVTPADTYPMQRWLGGLVETAGEYRRAFAGLENEAKAVIQEELGEAVGEQDGIPNQGITVPDIDGTDLAITLDSPNSYQFDLDALFNAVAFEVMESGGARAELWKLIEERGNLTVNMTAKDADAVLDTFLAGALVLAMQRLLDLGKFEPQVTKVKAFTNTLARVNAKIASTVQSGIRKTPQFRGVKVERKQPKK